MCSVVDTFSDCSKPSVRQVTSSEVFRLKSDHVRHAGTPLSKRPHGTRTVRFDVADLHARVFAKGEVAYLIEWEGKENPEGAEIDGASIAWIQDNTVRFIQHGCTGTYERLVRNGGAHGNTQKILVYFSPFVVQTVSNVATFRLLKMQQQEESAKMCTTGSKTASLFMPTDTLPAHERVYEVRWRGEAVPRGLALEGNRVVSAHQNLLTLCGPNRFARIGRYEVVFRYHGTNKDEHKILVYL